MKAVVTGATKGIGRSIVERLAAAGFDVAFCARTQADLDAMLLELQKRFPDVHFLAKCADMSQQDEVLDFAAMVLKEWNDIDILVNNAGIFLPGEISKEADGALETMINTNLYSAYHLTRAMLPVMMERKQGHIFNICSIASIFAYPNKAVHTAFRNLRC